MDSMYLLGVPRELLIHYICSDRNLCAADLVQLMLTSREFHAFVCKYCPLAKNQSEVFRSLFQSGSIRTLQWFQNNLQYPETSSPEFAEGLRYAARGGNLPLIAFRYEQAEARTGSIWLRIPLISAAAEEGHIHILQWFFDQKLLPPADFVLTEPLIEGACLTGRIDVLEWAFEHKLHLSVEFFSVTDKILTKAARYGQLPALQWLHARGYHPNSSDTLFAAISCGRLDIAQWLISVGCPEVGARVPAACALAAKAGNLDLLRWLRSRGYPWSRATCEAAAASGHLHILQWARANGCPWDSETCVQAATHGHWEILRWSYDNGPEWTSAVCAAAARNGHLDILQWLRSKGCPWSSGTCSSAASGGHLAVLKWARAEGCVWNEDTCDNAAWNDHLDVLQWAYANGCKFSTITYKYTKNEVIRQWLREKACPYSEN